MVWNTRLALRPSFSASSVSFESYHRKKNNVMIFPFRTDAPSVLFSVRLTLECQEVRVNGYTWGHVGDVWGELRNDSFKNCPFRMDGLFSVRLMLECRASEESV